MYNREDKFDHQNPEIAALEADLRKADSVYEVVRLEHKQIESYIKTRIDTLRTELRAINQEHYYVYACLINGRVKYISHGCEDDWLHCTSGNSPCSLLNEALLEHGLDNFLLVKIRENITKPAAQAFEFYASNGTLSRPDTELFGKEYEDNDDMDGDEYDALFWIDVAVSGAKRPDDTPKWWYAMKEYYDDTWDDE